MTVRITLRSLTFFSILTLGILQNYSVIAGQEDFPFRAEVTAAQVNVRAGQSSNFERLCQLKSGDEVIVLRKEYSWYKVQLPLSAKSFVHKNYIQLLGQNAGGVLGDRVNVRAGAGIHHTVLGQLTKGEQIFIEEEFDEWYRIKPVIDSYGWISEEFLAFKSNDVAEYHVALKEKKFVDLEPVQPVELSESEAEGAAENEAPKEEIIEEDAGTFYAVGYAEVYEGGENDGVHYKITTAGRPVCYVQGLNHMLGRFKNLRVSVEGTVNKKLQSKYGYPVIAVSKVRLML